MSAAGSQMLAGIPTSAAAGSGRASASPPGRRAPERLRVGTAMALAAATLAALLCVFAYVLASSQETSRHEAQQRFQSVATIAAGLTRAIVSSIGTPQLVHSAPALSGPTVAASALTDLASRSQASYAVVFAANGRELAASPGTPSQALARSGAPAAALLHGLAGQTWFSDVFAGAHGAELTENAVPYTTGFYGRRVAVIGYPLSALSTFLNTYLEQALPNKTTHAFLLDGAAAVIGSSVAKAPIGKRPSAALVDAVQASGQRGYHAKTGRRYVVVAPIGASAWRVAITEPIAQLYPELVGSRWWLMWTVFAAFALAALGALYMLRRTLHSAARISAQALSLEQANSALTAANAELDAFSYSVSHDLRAPLRAIDGFSRIVLEDDDGSLAESQRSHLELVRRSTMRMSELIDDLLAFSRLASQPLRRQPVSTAELVLEIEHDIERDHPTRGIEFRNGSLPAVEADPNLLRQVFVNLLGNAAKYSRSRDPSLITVDSELRDGELVFFVRDNGVGFDPDYAGRLFQVFQRLHRAEDYEGTGVGLAIAYRIVTRHGGRIWAQAAPEQGATFYFTLSA